MIIIGVDPDSEKSGVAVYVKGKLHQVASMRLFDIYDWLDINTPRGGYSNMEIHIEDVNGNRCSSFNWKPSDNKYVRAKKSEGVGKCKQVQVEIERIAEHFGIKVVRHKVSSKWKSQAGKKEFERVTGWKGRSNEDSRSAAYFGYLGTLTHQTR